MGAFHCPRRLICLSVPFNRFSMGILRSWSMRRHPVRWSPYGLSERKEQILKDLVKGLPNKIIARKLDIAEATVKVHMKSLLRKIRVANRTQAAIWALENGYGAADVHPELPRLEATLQPVEALLTEARAVR